MYMNCKFTAHFIDTVFDSWTSPANTKRFKDNNQAPIFIKYRGKIA